MNEKILVWFDEVLGILNLIFDIVILKLIRVIFFVGYLYIKFVYKVWYLLCKGF